MLNEQVYFQGKGQSLPPQKRNVGYLFQDYALFPHMTVEKNIAMVLKIKWPLVAKRPIDQCVRDWTFD